MADETPLVHRSVRSGGILFLAVAAQFVAVTVWVQTQLSGFSLTGTRVSDLTAAPPPWGALFGASLAVLGAGSFVALLLSWSAFDNRPIRALGLFPLLVASVAAVLVGAGWASGYAGLSSIAQASEYAGVLALGLGFLVLPSAMHQQERWRFSRVYTRLSGLVVLGAAALYGFGFYLGLGPGGIERLGLAAAVLWTIVEGAHLALLHRYAPGLHVKVAAA